MSAEVDGPEAAPAGDTRPLVEIGWVLAGDLHLEVREALDQAHRRALEELSRLGAFRFDLRLRRRPAPPEHAVEPIALIDIGALELDAGRWDFAVVVTPAELRAYDKPFAFGAPASSLNVAALSTARLAPDAPDGRVEILAARIVALFLHLFGHLNDLEHSEDRSSFMHDPQVASDLDEMRSFSPEHLERLTTELAREADERIEERSAAVGAARFYVEASWDNRSDIYHAMMKIRPWRFFTAFSRLTTTAVSAMVVLLITAEAWDMGVRQSTADVLGAGALAILLTTAYVLERQKLLERLRNRALTEQRVIANVSVSLAVLVGMATIYVSLFLAALCFTELLQPKALVADWIPGALGPVGTSHYVTMCAFVATLGVILGALGASFESETYFRHVVLVDEET